MSRFHGAVRAAVVARLRAAPALPATVYSNPPIDVRPPIILVASIVSDEPLTKDGPAAFYSVSVEHWAQTTSPLSLDAMAAAAAARLDDGVALAAAGATLGGANLITEVDEFHPDAPGGPTLSRTQTFRVFADA